MKRWKLFFKSLSVKTILLTGMVCFCLVLWGILTLFSVVKKNELADQTVAARWSAEGDAAQISCFFTESTEVDKNTIKAFEVKLDTVLTEASITPSNENARLWADAYSAQGEIVLASDKQTLDVKAVGIGGDFFLFHPLRLLNGSYFDGNDLMQDKIIIDEDAAWQLFGSNDVVGMKVTIGGIPHYISGVVRREEGHFHEAAGLNQTVVYVSYETLTEYGTTEGINAYEIVMPDPVEDFAYKAVKENFGINENGMWVVENSSRYGWENLLTVLSEFGVRSMNTYPIRYPYWENVARGFEDVLALVFVLQILALLIPTVIVVVSVTVMWKRRQWTWKDVGSLLVAGKDKVSERFRAEKDKWKHF